uniref:SET domain-containing protein n=1 Tax=Poecilia formosa TaxID=48698 RepID=A0A096LX81_POEFO
EVTDIGAFFSTFPVTLDGEPPLKKKRVEAGFPGSRGLFDKWRAAQQKLRRHHLMTKWSKQRPRLDQVQSFLRRSGWSTNCIPAEEVVRRWVPPSTGQEEQDVLHYVRDQNWTGLIITESQKDGAGRGVFATRDFNQGSHICDYHGRVISASEGRRIMESLKEGEGSYIFFFKTANKDLCIDAQAEHCQCHPQLTTFGRLINHSAKNFNVKCVVAKLAGLAEPTLLIKATRDICAGEEILIDYGVRRRSFGGEGMDLPWL